MTKKEEFEREAKLIINKWQSEPKCTKLADVFAEALQKAVEQRDKDNIELLKRMKFDGEFKDCPAAWINACLDKFITAIRERQKGKI